MRRIAAGLAVSAICLAITALSTARAADSAALHVLATGLNQPKKITIMPNGDLLVALSGNGRHGASCTKGTERSCLNRSGEVDLITPSGQVTTLLKDLPSVSSGGAHGDATGPVQALAADGRLQVLFQDTDMNLTTGATLLGASADRLGQLAAYSAATLTGTPEASFGAFEARHNPDHSTGTDVKDGLESGIDSDPYAVVPYRGGDAVADAGANDVLWLSPAGHISVLAVLPTIAERAAAGTYGKRQTTAITAQAQSVPDSLAVGADGALYVGELGGLPFDVGASSVYRIVPGHAATRYATGLTAIGDIAFDKQGRLLVLELDTKGLKDTDTAHPASGAIVRIAADGRHTVVAGTGLQTPTGLAVAADGTIYVSNRGTSTGTGEIVTVTER